MALLVDIGRADELALLAVLSLQARAERTAATCDQNRVRVAAGRVALRAMRDEANRLGLELLDGERAGLDGDTASQAQADIDCLLAAFEAQGGHSRYRLDEWRRHAADWVSLREVLWEIMANTPAEYARMIQDELQQVIGSEHPGWTVHQRCSPVTQRAWELAERVVGTATWRPGSYDGPLALPGSVCEVLLADSAILWAYTCGVCGYEVPSSWVQRASDGRFLGFLPCPVCGGKVGYCAWYETKRALKQGGLADA